MAEHNELGNKGELLAKEYLENGGYEILAVNWKYGRKEIDIIGKIDDVVAIIEVKTRSTDYFGKPEEFVTKAKQKFLIEAADNFVQNLDFDAEIRYDIISIVLNGKKQNIIHIEDAFIPLLD